MANIWEHPSVVAAEALSHLEDALILAPLCAMDKTSEFTTRSNGWKVGDSVSFRTNGEYEVKDFTTTIDVQDIANSSRNLTIEKHLDVSVEVTARELALDLDSFSDQVLKDAMYRLAAKVDGYLGEKILQGAGLYLAGTGALFGSAADVSQARKTAILQQLNSNRYCVLDRDLEATLLGSTWYNQDQTRGADGTDTLKTGRMGPLMGMDLYASDSFPTNSTAFSAGTMVCLTNNSSGTKNLIGDTALTVDGQTASRVVEAGDRVYVAGVRRPLKVKTAIADTTSTTSVELVDPITEIIPDNAAVTVIGSGKDHIYHGAIFDSKSLGVAFPMLDLPESETAATISNGGIGIRMVKAYNITTKKTTLSLDLLCGAFALDPRRITLLGEQTT